MRPRNLFRAVPRTALRSMAAALCLGTALPLAALPALAQTTRDIGVVPNNPNPTVDLSIDWSRGEVRIGDRVEFCVTASRPGYVTLWNIGTSGATTRILPNRFTGERIEPVVAGRRYCAGSSAESFAFEVRPPTGIETIYAIWSETLDAQPDRADFRSVSGLTKDIDVVGRDRLTWATAKVSFEVVDPLVRHDTLFAPRAAPRAEGDYDKVWILAFSANVAPLTKTDEDAEGFTDVMQSVFDVPEARTRLLVDARLSDVRGGFDWLRRKAGPRDLVLVYYSGHGFSMRDISGDEPDDLDEVYVLMDANHGGFPTANEVLLDDDFATMIDSLETSKIVTVIDSCFSGGLYKSIQTERVAGKTKFLNKSSPAGALTLASAGYGTPAEAPGGIETTARGTPVTPGVFLAAAEEAQFAQEGVDGGIFTVALLRQFIDGRHGTFRAAFDATRREVRAMTGGEQIPDLIGESDLLTGIRLR